MTEGIKQAALKLYGLPDADRQWTLSQLDPATRKHLISLLDELATFGLDPATVAEVSEVDEALFAYVGKTASNDYIERINALSDEKAEQILSAQPDFLIALFLSLYAWQWTKKMLARLPEKRQAQVNIFLSEGFWLQPALKNALLENLAHELGEDPSSNHFDVLLDRAMLEEASPTRSLFTRLLHKWLP